MRRRDHGELLERRACRVALRTAHARGPPVGVASRSLAGPSRAAANEALTAPQAATLPPAHRSRVVRERHPIAKLGHRASAEPRTVRPELVPFAQKQRVPVRAAAPHDARVLLHGDSRCADGNREPSCMEDSRAALRASTTVYSKHSGMPDEPVAELHKTAGDERPNPQEVCAHAGSASADADRCT
jgi:hypothetical protein